MKKNKQTILASVIASVLMIVHVAGSSLPEQLANSFVDKNTSRLLEVLCKIHTSFIYSAASFKNVLVDMLWFKFYFLCFGYGNFDEFETKEIKFEPRIKLNHNNTAKEINSVVTIIHNKS